MDILAGIEAASSANNNLKQYMATVNQLASVNGLSPSELDSSNTLGAALQALTNPLAFGNIAQLLPSGQSMPNIGPFNPLLVAAAAAFSEQHSKSVFNSSPLALSLPSMANFNALPNILHQQIGQSQGPAEQHSNGQKEEQNVPTLVSLLASASVGTPQRQQTANCGEKQMTTTTTQSPSAKRAKLSQQKVKKEEQCEHSNLLFGTSTASEFSNAVVGSPSVTEVPSTASLLSALTAVSGKFPLAAASPPALPSPPCAQNSMASSMSYQSQKSAQNSPTNRNALVRRLSSLSASSSSTTGTFGGAAMTHNGMTIVLPRTPQRKPAAPIPPEKRDSVYYERRRKNNDAAKRSRDTRRMKEEMTAQRAAYLEKENIQLKKQVDMLKAELAQHKAILLSIAAPPANASSSLPNTPPTKPRAERRRRHFHVLASPTSTTTTNETNSECLPGTNTVETEGDGIRAPFVEMRKGDEEEEERETMLEEESQTK